MSTPLRDKILSRMAQFGIEPKRSLGQNFLVSDSVVDRIIKGARPGDFKQVVEIGPGLGALTDHLLEQSEKLTLFELDKKFSEYWRERGADLIEGDALKNNWKDFAWEGGPNLLVSNLPYQISSRLVVELSLINPSFDRMVLMFQKEVAQRLLAEESTEEYGLLTVVAQVFWKLQLLLEAGAVDFHPKPNVASRVVIFNRKEVNPQLYHPSFLSFLKSCFANRRKKLLPKLTAFASKDDLKLIFNSLDLNDSIRAEKLTPQQFIELYLKLKK